MKKVMKKVVIGFGLVALVAGLSACGHPTPQEREERMLKKISYKMDLTDEQKPLAKELVVAISETRQALRKQSESYLPKVSSMVTQPTLDSAEVTGMIDAHIAVLETNKQTVVNKAVAFHAVLNNEQKQELQEMLEKVQRHFDRRKND